MKDVVRGSVATTPSHYGNALPCGRVDGVTRPRVVFIVGYGRSGSTLLDLMLGSAPGAVSAGELRNIWRRGFQQDQRCSCGASFSACPFWDAVVAQTFAEGIPDIEATLALRRHANASRRVRRRVVDPDAATDSEQRYLAIWQRLYRAVGQVGGAGVVIDSSKEARHAFSFAASDDIDARYIHLIRDGRAAAFSRTRAKHRPEVHGGGSMRVRNPFRSALRWRNVNNQIEWFARRVPRLVRLRYEDLMADPLGALRNTVAALGLDLEYPDGLMRGREVMLPPNHMVSGNPMRFQSGPVALREDTQWRQAMPLRHRLAVAILAGRLLRRYGYFDNQRFASRYSRRSRSS